MKILDNLKRIFETKFSNFFNNINVTLIDFSRNTTNVLELKEGGILSIDLSKTTSQEKLLLKQNVVDVTVQKDKQVFLNRKSASKVNQIKQNLPLEKDQKLLEFYKDKLRPEMYKALEASLVVRNSFKNGGEIKELKRDIARQYPSFGNNLCNMVGEKYFDNHFKDLYYSMLNDEDPFDIRTYQRKVKKIVVSLPYTVFVTRYKSYDSMSGEIMFKLGKLRKYGTGKLLIHGLGKENVATTLALVGDYEDEEYISIQIEINPSKTIITATLTF